MRYNQTRVHLLNQIVRPISQLVSLARRLKAYWLHGARTLMPQPSLCHGLVDDECDVGKLARLGKRYSTSANVKDGVMTDSKGEILTLDEVVAYLKAWKRTVYRLAQKGEIPVFKPGGRWCFRRAELDLWIATRIGRTSVPDEIEGEY